MCWFKSFCCVALVVGIPLVQGVQDRRTACFTAGYGPKPMGVPCVFPFTFNGVEYNECAVIDSLDDAPQGYGEMLQAGSIEDEDLLFFDDRQIKPRWCGTASGTDVAGTENWGICAECDIVVHSNRSVSSPSPPRTTTGCPCLQLWKPFGHRHCESYCCAPDYDDRPWCVVDSYECESEGWGYCNMTKTGSNASDDEEEYEFPTWYEEFTTASPTTFTPSSNPTLQPSSSPTMDPTSTPSRDPTMIPTLGPSKTPSKAPIPPSGDLTKDPFDNNRANSRCEHNTIVLLLAFAISWLLGGV